MACTHHIASRNDSHDLCNGLVHFEEWLGQVDPRRPVHCALEVGPKKDMKTMVDNGMAPYPT
jgi:hypothetical protein